MATPAHITEQLNELAQKKAQKLLERARKVLDTPRFRNSGELVDSLQVKVTLGTATHPPVITLTFSDQGFFLAMKNPSWSKVPWRKGKRGLEDWVRRRPGGSSSFDYVSGYGRGQQTQLSESAKVKRIASGIAWAFRKHQLRWKPKTWKRQTLVQLLIELNEQTARVWEEGIVMQVESELYKTS